MFIVFFVISDKLFSHFTEPDVGRTYLHEGFSKKKF
jgi:hypothetical protein